MAKNKKAEKTFSIQELSYQPLASLLIAITINVPVYLYLAIYYHALLNTINNNIT
jgi:hypothetical protein